MIHGHNLVSLLTLSLIYVVCFDLLLIDNNNRVYILLGIAAR